MNRGWYLGWVVQSRMSHLNNPGNSPSTGNLLYFINSIYEELIPEIDMMIWEPHLGNVHFQIPSVSVYIYSTKIITLNCEFSSKPYLLSKRVAMRRVQKLFQKTIFFWPPFSSVRFTRLPRWWAVTTTASWVLTRKQARRRLLAEMREAAPIFFYGGKTCLKAS